MWQVLKAVTILFTICLGLQRKKDSPCYFRYKKKQFSTKNGDFFRLVIFTKRTFQIKYISLAVKNHCINQSIGRLF